MMENVEPWENRSSRRGRSNPGRVKKRNRLRRLKERVPVLTGYTLARRKFNKLLSIGVLLKECQDRLPSVSNLTRLKGYG